MSFENIFKIYSLLLQNAFYLWRMWITTLFHYTKKVFCSGSKSPYISATKYLQNKITLETSFELVSIISYLSFIKLGLLKNLMFYIYLTSNDPFSFWAYTIQVSKNFFNFFFLTSNVAGKKPFFTRMSKSKIKQIKLKLKSVLMLKKMKIFLDAIF